MLFDCNALWYWGTITHERSLALFQNVKVDFRVTPFAFYACTLCFGYKVLVTNSQL